MPALFVVLWSTGFIGAKFGLPYAGPMTFLALRMGIASLLLGLLAWRSGATIPGSGRDLRHAVIAGLLVHGGYLGGVFSAIHHGMPSGMVSLIVGMQPVLTALLAGTVLGERLSPRRWAGMGLGLVGLAVVLAQRVHLADLTLTGACWSALGLVSISAGTVYQKRHCQGMDLLSGAAIQFGACAVVFAALSGALEDPTIHWNLTFVLALAWLTLGLSLGAVGLLYRLIRDGAAARVASLFYLVPPLTALIAYGAFGEQLSPGALVGMGIVATGVALVIL